MSNTKFTIDDKKMLIERSFAAPIATVWKAWTTAEILDQWWAPKPWKTETREMYFRNGGHWLYSMNGPEGEKHWARADYESIVTERSYVAEDCFCDENGVRNNEMPGMHWNVTFIPDGENTVVRVDVTCPTPEALKTVVEMGMKEGISAAHDNLDALLPELV